MKDFAIGLLAVIGIFAGMVALFAGYLWLVLS